MVQREQEKKVESLTNSEEKLSRSDLFEDEKKRKEEMKDRKRTDAINVIASRKNIVNIYSFTFFCRISCGIILFVFFFFLN